MPEQKPTFRARLSSVVADKRTLRVAKWLVFGAIGSLLPLVTSFALMRTKGLLVEAPVVVKHGELLLVAVGVASDGVGEALSRDLRSQLLKIVCGGGCLFIALFSLVMYNGISETLVTGGLIDSAVVMQESVVAWVCAMAAALGCIVSKGD